MHLIAVNGPLALSELSRMSNVVAGMQSLFLHYEGFISADLIVDEEASVGVVATSWSNRCEMQAFVESSALENVLERLSPLFESGPSLEVYNSLVGVGHRRLDIHREHIRRALDSDAA